MTQEKDNKKSVKKYVRFSAMGIQMGVVIAFFTWLGTFLDKKYPNDHSVWTICLSLFGVFAGLYLVIKEVIKMGNEN